MPKVIVRKKNFAPSSGVGNGPLGLSVSWAALIWAAVTVGRRSRVDVLKHGQYSVMELVYRAALVYANLKCNDLNGFCRSEAFDGLDPSEKSAVSYFLGMSFSKVFCDKVLATPWLMHLDLYGPKFNLRVNPGDRPDLFGLDSSNRWIVLESKGRTGAFTTNAMAKAKHQASQVVAINGSPPFLTIGVVSSFRKNGELRLDVDDPPVERDELGLQIEMSAEEFRREYFAPIHSLLNRLDAKSQQRDGRSFRVGWVRSLDIEIGLAADASDGHLASPLEGSQLLSREFIGRDGVLIRLGETWDDSAMRLEPQVREI